MSMSVNGQALSDMGLQVLAANGLRGWTDGVRIRRDAEALSGEFGMVESLVVTTNPRQIRAVCKLTESVVANRNASLEDALDQMRGRLELSFDDQPDKVVMARLEESSPVEGLGSHTGFTAGVPLLVTLEFVAYQPLFHDAVAQVAAFDSTARDVPMGTAPHEGIIRITGEPTDPTITVRDFRGTSQGTLGFTGTLAADQAWIIDLYQHTVTLSDSGVETADDDQLTSGNFFEFDPGWASYGASAWPTLEIDQGNADLTYFRGWRT